MCDSPVKIHNEMGGNQGQGTYATCIDRKLSGDLGSRTLSQSSKSNKVVMKIKGGHICLAFQREGKIKCVRSKQVPECNFNWIQLRSTQ